MVMLEAETNLDIFFLGQMYGEMCKFKLDTTHALASSDKEDKPHAKITIKKEEFIQYLIRKL